MSLNHVSSHFNNFNLKMRPGDLRVDNEDHLPLS